MFKIRTSWLWNDNTFGVRFYCISSRHNGISVTIVCCLGCTLSKDKPEYTWLNKQDKDNVGEVDILNQLALSQVSVEILNISCNVYLPTISSFFWLCVICVSFYSAHILFCFHFYVELLV